MPDHNNEDKASASHVAPPAKEYKNLILEQLLKEIDGDCKGKDFSWILCMNH